MYVYKVILSNILSIFAFGILFLSKAGCTGAKYEDSFPDEGFASKHWLRKGNHSSLKPSGHI